MKKSIHKSKCNDSTTVNYFDVKTPDVIHHSYALGKMITNAWMVLIFYAETDLTPDVNKTIC